MAKNSSPNSNRADKDSAAYAKASSKLSESELSLVNTELGIGLRRAAVFFIAELKDRFDPKATKSSRTNKKKGTELSPGANLVATEFADKFVRLGREHSDTRDTDTLLSNSKIRNLFYDPSMFEKGTWHTLSRDERLQIISTGLKVVGPIIAERYRADLRPPVRKARQIETTEGSDASLHEYDVGPARLPPALIPNTPPGAPTDAMPTTAGAGSVEHSAEQTEQPAVPTETRRRAAFIMPPPAFNLSILKTRLDQIPWEDQRLDGAIARRIEGGTLFDLLNLSLNEFEATLRNLSCELPRFKEALKAVRDEKNMSHGKALALLCSPLGDAQGDFRLNSDSVQELSKIKVFPLRWNGDHLDLDVTKNRVGIDNYWRLLQNYHPKQYEILAKNELTSLRDLFEEAGIYVPRKS